MNNTKARRQQQNLERIMHNSKPEIYRLSAALAIATVLSFSSVFADATPESAAGFDQNTLIDWSQKAQAALTQKLDAKLTRQLSSQPDNYRFAEVLPQQYHNANLLLAGEKIDQFNVAPLSSIPVVILVNPEEDCLLNL